MPKEKGVTDRPRYKIPWQREIRCLCKDFGVSLRITSDAIKEAKAQIVPKFYKGDENAFRYDYAYRKVKPAIKESMAKW